MDSELLRKTDELLGHALRLPPDQRERFVLSETVAHPAVREALLSRLNETTCAPPATSPLEETMLADPDATLITGDAQATVATGDPGSAPRPAQAPGAPQIPNLVIEGLLAQGGMGAVYAGIQIEEGFQRKVAVKVVKPELASRGVMQRFFQERQVLASLDHPNVARLLEAGTTREGAPYLVMEYVEGERINDYCQSHQLDYVHRLRLFVTVCEAVQYAHQRLIVHRDIKPGNIMVSADGTPKLLDFGIAKLVAPTEDETVIAQGLTAGGDAPMTPMYASPEQVRNETVTTSTDLYSLAILLYEILTGSLPYEFKQLTAAGIERTITETEPTPLSQAVLKRQLAPSETEAKLRRKFSGELDVILATALRKEPARRYASVYQFGDDIRRHLNGEPVLAHKDSVRYRVGKFVRRHKGGVAAAVLAVISLAAAAVVSTYFARVAQQEKVVAERRFKETRELATYFLTDLDEAIRRGETKARGELVEKGVGYLRRLSEEAAGDVSLQRDVLRGYVKMGDILGNPFGPNLADQARARATYEQALSIGLRYSNSSAAGTLAQELALIRKKIADLDSVSGQRETALKAYREAEKVLAGLELVELRYQTGWLLSQTGKSQEALEAFRGAMKAAADVLEREPQSRKARNELARAAERVGQMLSGTGDLPGAIENLQAALKSHEQSLAEEPGSSTARRRVWSASTLLADAYRKSKQYPAAEASIGRAIAISEQQRLSDPTNSQHRIDYFMARGRQCSLLEEQPARRDAAHAATASLLKELKTIVDSGNATQFEIDQYTWNLLTTPFTDLRDFSSALPLVERAVQKQPNDPRVLDMLAMAQFGLGRTSEAVSTEKKALTFVGEGPSALRTELEANLRKFSRGGGGITPFR